METRDFMMIFFVILLLVTFIVVFVMWYSIGCCTYTTDSNTSEDTIPEERATRVKTRAENANISGLIATRRMRARNPIDTLGELGREIGNIGVGVGNTEIPIFRKSRITEPIEREDPIRPVGRTSHFKQRSILDELHEANGSNGENRSKVIDECKCDDHHDFKPIKPIEPITPIVLPKVKDFGCHSQKVSKPLLVDLASQSEIVADLKDDIDQFGSNLISKLSETINGSLNDISTQITNIEDTLKDDKSNVTTTTSNVSTASDFTATVNSFTTQQSNVSTESTESTESDFTTTTSSSTVQQSSTQATNNTSTPKIFQKRDISYSNLDNVISDINSQLDAIMNGK